MYQNIYYHPEAFNLEVVAEIEYSDQNYVFDTRVVWREKTSGKLFTARDSGCSCPTPFEDYHLGNIAPVTLAALRAEIQTELKDRFPNITPEDGQEFIRKVREAKARK